MKKQILFLAGILSFVFANAQNTDSAYCKKIADEILRNGKAYENLYFLTKNIGPRLAGSEGMVMAENWGLFAMQQAGADKAWLQECMVPHWVRGGTDMAAAYLADKKARALDVVALGNSIGTGKKGIKAEVVEVKSFQDLEAKKDQVKGKIVFYNYHFDPTFIRTFQSYSDANKYRGQGPSMASK